MRLMLGANFRVARSLASLFKSWQCEQRTNVLFCLPKAQSACLLLVRNNGNG